MTLSRRSLLQLSGGLAAGALTSSLPVHAADGEVPPALASLQPMTAGVEPITVDEHRARIARAQALMRTEGLEAVVLAAGTGLTYFTGAEWGASERLFAAVVPRDGEPAWVCPAFEKARGLEQIRIGSDVRAWEEHESPFALVAGILRDRAAVGTVGIEEYLPFTFAHAIGAALPGARLVPATPVTAGCRMIKDAHEIALMRRANEITVHAHRAVFRSLREG
ncbi:MAG TPA: aminopeptidase P family N-terminal domain-containing protein, partial [Vicinamibacteria bacterium]|nr:aminopeptidase P family N-terminal domain-containing protein [Vicinamibacteria bacterium]